jgi:hypothetical protein
MAVVYASVALKWQFEDEETTDAAVKLLSHGLIRIRVFRRNWGFLLVGVAHGFKLF